MLALAQERECTPEELIHTLLVDTEQAQYYHANQQMLAQGILASIPQTVSGDLKLLSTEQVENVG